MRGSCSWISSYRRLKMWAKKNCRPSLRGKENLQHNRKNRLTKLNNKIFHKADHQCQFSYHQNIHPFPSYYPHRIHDEKTPPATQNNTTKQKTNTKKNPTSQDQEHYPSPALQHPSVYNNDIPTCTTPYQ